MNVSTTGFSPAQMILAWMLLLLLLSWFMIFASLALRDFVMKKVEWEDIPTGSKPIPIIGVFPNEDHQNIVEMTGVTKHNDHTNTERSNDNGTSLFK